MARAIHNMYHVSCIMYRFSECECEKRVTSVIDFTQQRYHCHYHYHYSKLVVKTNTKNVGHSLARMAPTHRTDANCTLEMRGTASNHTTLAPPPSEFPASAWPFGPFLAIIQCPERLSIFGMTPADVEEGAWVSDPLGPVPGPPILLKPPTPST